LQLAKKVLDLAKELNIEEKKLIEKSIELGIDIKDANSSLKVKDIELIKKELKERSSKSKKQSSKKKEETKENKGKTQKSKEKEKTSKKKAKTKEKKEKISKSKDQTLKKKKQTSKSTEKTEDKKQETKEQKLDSIQQTVEKKKEESINKKELTPKESEEKPDDKATTEKSSEGSKDKKTIEVSEGATVKEFADLIGQDSAGIIKTLFDLGEMVTINQGLSEEEISILADELGFEAKIVSYEDEDEKELEDKIDEGKAIPRPPIVTIMGHVDHGKTLLLDSIRKTNVVSTEAGGITQHIGAYQVIHNDKKITFVDTPGHEAFTEMRARGAQITDVAILVVAADDGVKPQTLEAIDHARAAKVPIIVAVNKIDKQQANPEKVRQELSKQELTPEEWGGKTVFVDISAKKNQNIDELLEMIILVSEMQELKAVIEGMASGTVIESKIDKGKGPVATVLVKQGRMNVGDVFVAGMAYGKARALFDDVGKKVKEAHPAQPVEIIGFKSLPKAGDVLKVVEDEKKARDIAEKRALRQRLIEEKQKRHLTLEDLHHEIEEGKIKELNIIVKAGVQGSIEALKKSLSKIDQEEVRLKVIHSGVGAITETDIMLASASNAIITGFNVRPDANAKKLAEIEKVDVRTYKIIYELVEDINSARIGMLKPKIEEVVEGEATVKELFKAPKIGVIAGCAVTNGLINRKSKIRVIREGVVIQDTKVASLKRFKNDVNEVKEGYECGIGLENFQDLKARDIFEAYKEVEKPREK